MKVFNTTQSDLIKYNGMECEVVGRVDPSRYDFAEVGVIYEIKLSDGTHIQAYPDEIADKESPTNMTNGRA